MNKELTHLYGVETLDIAAPVVAANPKEALKIALKKYGIVFDEKSIQPCDNAQGNIVAKISLLAGKRESISYYTFTM